MSQVPSAIQNANPECPRGVPVLACHPPRTVPALATASTEASPAQQVPSVVPLLPSVLSCFPPGEGVVAQGVGIRRGVGHRGALRLELAEAAGGVPHEGRRLRLLLLARLGHPPLALAHPGRRIAFLALGERVGLQREGKGRGWGACEGEGECAVDGDGECSCEGGCDFEYKCACEGDGECDEGECV